MKKLNKKERIGYYLLYIYSIFWIFLFVLSLYAQTFIWVDNYQARILLRMFGGMFSLVFLANSIIRFNTAIKIRKHLVDSIEV